MGIPVLFGPHMEDFSEIAQSLVDCDGGKAVRNEDELSQTLISLLKSPEKRKSNGLSAKQVVDSHRGVIDKHLNLIQTLL
jgi:3-deoxy-D-manno-octulosonic-acid transferase